MKLSVPDHVDSVLYCYAELGGMSYEYAMYRLLSGRSGYVLSGKMKKYVRGMLRNMAA